MTEPSRSGPFGWLRVRGRFSAPPLGERELAIMQVLWAEGSLSAQQVLDHLGSDSLSVNAVFTTLEKLTGKGVLERSRRARTFYYRAVMDRRTLIGLLLRDIGEEIAGGDLAPMVSGFVDYVGSDPQAESELRRLLDPEENADPEDP